MSLQKKYIELRAKHVFVLYLMAVFILIVSILMWKYAIFYVNGLFFLLIILEYFLVKCPYCKKRPFKIFYNFPRMCCQCGKSLF